MNNYFNDQNFIGFMIPKILLFLALLVVFTLGFGLLYYLAYQYMGVVISIKGMVLNPIIF